MKETNFCPLCRARGIFLKTHKAAHCRFKIGPIACNFCGGAHKVTECPEIESKKSCLKCGRNNHLTSECFAKRANPELEAGPMHKRRRFDPQPSNFGFDGQQYNDMMRQTRQEAMYEYMQKQQREAMYNDYYFEMQNRQQAPYFDRRSPPPWQPRQQGQQPPYFDRKSRQQQQHDSYAYASEQPTRQHNSGQHHRSFRGGNKDQLKTDQLKKNDDKNDREDGEVKMFESRQLEKEEDDLYDDKEEEGVGGIDIDFDIVKMFEK